MTANTGNRYGGTGRA